MSETNKAIAKKLKNKGTLTWYNYSMSVNQSETNQDIPRKNLKLGLQRYVSFAT